MSVNSTLDQSYLSEVEAISRLLRGFIDRRKAVPTEDEKAVVEAEVVQLFERLLALDHKLQALRPGDYPQYEEYIEDYSYFNYLLQVNLAKLRRLTALFLKHVNTQQYLLADLYGKLKRIRQKQAALALWNGDDAKFVLAERFLNLDWLDKRFSSEDLCHVDVAQGILSLPIRDTKSLPVSSVAIGSGSNGVPGNSDVKVTTNNSNPEYVVNGDPGTWFEYQRLDRGPLELYLVVELGKAEVVNSIALTPLNIGQAYSFVVEDILLSGGETPTVSALELAPEVGPDRMTVKSAGNDSEWSFTFLPVSAKTITIKMRQTHSHEVNVVGDDLEVRKRQRFSIGISKLNVNQIRYDGKGEINSIERQIPNGLYLATPVADVTPAKPELFSAGLQVSFDGGANWSVSDEVGDALGQSLRMGGQETGMFWRLSLSRDDEALDNTTSFTPVTDTVRNVKVLQKPVSKNQSPASVTLPDRPARGEVFVIQSKLARRGDSRRKIYLGQGVGVRTNFELPFSVVANGVDPENVRIYANGVQYSYVEDNVTLAAEQWSFSDDFSEVQIGSALAVGSRVTMVLDEERMLFDQRGDGYYHQTTFMFDPDERNIKVERVARQGAKVTKLLPRDKRIIKLNERNIDPLSFKLTSALGIPYALVATRALLASTSQSYLLDSKNGILWLNAEFDSDVVRATFVHANANALDASGFDVVYEEGSLRPWGVRVAPDAFEAIQGEDTVGLVGTRRFDPVDGTWSVRGGMAASNAIRLSYDYVVAGTVSVSSDLFNTAYLDALPQEVGFIDGTTEFLGLITMNDEKTVEIQGDSGGLVEFLLSAGRLWYRDLPPVFDNTSVFQSQKSSFAAVTSVGDYYIDPDGLVTLFVGVSNSLAAGINIQYYYQDPEFEPVNKYSVDYRNGVLYGGSDLVSNAVVKYKAAGYKISYDIVEEVDQYEYDRQTNAVEIRTEGMRTNNKLVKIIWDRKTSENSLRAYRDFFSPLISLLAFRFN